MTWPEDPLWGDRELANRLGDVLRLREATEPSAERQQLIGEIDGAAGSGRPLADRPDILGAIERSSLGTPDSQELRLRAPADAIAEILARAAEIDDETVPPADGPIGDWFDALGQLDDARGSPPDILLKDLDGFGFPLTQGELGDLLTSPPVCPDRELVRSLVTVLGGDWTGSGYEALHDAALEEQAGARRHPARTGGPSGIGGADELNQRSLAAQVRVQPETMPPIVWGRDELLARLTALLEQPTASTQVLVGRGGGGKSTVALAVAAQALERGHHVWWVTAADTNQVIRGMLAVATELRSPVAVLNAIQSAPHEGAELLWHRLHECRRRWLLIFDDADEPETLRAVPDDPWWGTWFRPSTAGTVMITSRVADRSAWGEHAELHDVADLPADAGAQVILDRIRPIGGAPDPPDLVAHARALSERLGGVPLALRNVGSYLGSGLAAESIAELVRSLDAMRRAEAHLVSDNMRSRITTTWDLSLTALADKGVPEARTLLRLLSCYAPNWVVPLDLLAPERLDPILSGDGVIGGWKAALDGLLDVGLLDRKATAGQGVEGVVIHPLVAEVSRADEKIRTVADVEAAAVELLWQGVRGLDAGRPVNWPILRRLEPHVYALLGTLRTTRTGVQAAALRTADRTAEALIRAGLYAPGEQLIRHARSSTALAPDHPQSLATEHTLAWALGLRGELGEAGRRLDGLVADRVRTCGPEHEATLAALDLQAWVLAEQGRLEDADRRLHELVSIRRRTGGPLDKDTLATRHRLAWVTAVRGRPDDAEREFRDLLPQRLATLGPDHMEVLSTRYRLAWAVGQQGRTAEAETLFIALGKDVDRSFAEHSAAAIMVRSRLGWVRVWQGRFAEAERDHRQVLQAREHLLGADHPRTLLARLALAWGLWMAGDHRDAERRYRELLADCDGNLDLGKDHPLTLDTLGRLAELLLACGRLDEAERRLRALVPHRRRVSGPDHPATLIVRRLLATLAVARGHHRDAQIQLEVLVADQARVHGPDHRNTLTTRATLAELRGLRGDLATARRELAEVHAVRADLLGPDHPDTLASRNLLVWVLGETELLDEARERCHELLADRARVLGPDHPDTLDTRYRLGWILGLAERGAEAEREYREVLDRQHRVLGRDHPHCLRTRHGLATEQLRLGRTDDAERDLRGVLLDRTRTLGRQHPDTLAARHALAVVLAVGGSQEGAEKRLRDLLFDQLRLLGAEHRDTLGTQERLIWVQERRGRLEEAAEHWRQLVRDRERCLGPDHPDTRRARDRVASWSHEVDHLW